MSKQTFPNYVIEKMCGAFYESQEKALINLVDSHIKKTSTDVDAPIGIKYKSIYRIRNSNGADRIKLEKLDKSLEEAADKILNNESVFIYDMDKLRNFLSFIVRFDLSDKELSELVPQYFLKEYKAINSMRFIQVSPPVNIKEKFAEEIQILQRYYLMIMLKEME